MSLHFKNTLGGATAPFEPLEPGRVRMYSCGPTVYKRPHIGNFRAFVLSDLLRRTFLERLGVDPTATAAGGAQPTFGTFLLTSVAWHSGGGEIRADPLPAEVAASFLRNVASRRTAPSDAPGRARHRSRSVRRPCRSRS